MVETFTIVGGVIAGIIIIIMVVNSTPVDPGYEEWLTSVDNK